MSAAYPVLVSSRGAARCVRVFPGEPRQVPLARAFVARALAGCPAREALLACVSELAANAITHTASGAGGVFSVEVAWPADGVVRVAVTDAGSQRGAVPATPDGHAGPGLAECGRGLMLVAAFSSSWGYSDAAGEGTGRTVWAEATWPASAVA